MTYDAAFSYRMCRNYLTAARVSFAAVMRHEAEVKTFACNNKE